MGTQSYAYNEDQMMAGIATYRSGTKKNILATKSVARKLINEVAEKMNISREALLSPSHEKHVVTAREAVVLVLRQEHGYKLARIGRILKRHHTTVMHAYDQAKLHYRNHPPFREIVDSLSKMPKPSFRDELGIPL